MVSLDEIKRSFGSFIDRVSKMKGKGLKGDELTDFSIQITILKNLLEGKGFLNQSEDLNKIKKGVLSRGSISEKDIKKLKEILGTI